MEESRPPQKPASVRLRRWYHKKRTYALFLMAVGCICLLGFVIALKTHPKSVVERALSIAGDPASIRDVAWGQDGSLVIRTLRIPGGNREDAYLKVSRIIVNWNWAELLWSRRVAFIELDKPEVWISRLNKALDKSNKGGGGGFLSDWTISTLNIHSGTLTLDNLGEGIPAVPISVGRSTPLVLKDIRLAKGKTAGGEIEQLATISNLTVTSPYDAISPILHFDAINIHFTWNELRSNEIRELEIIGPTIYLGPDLFWFTDKFSKARSEKKGAAGTPWHIREFIVRAGRLAINAAGQPGVTLPFTFVSEAKDIRLDQVDKITLNNKIIIPPQDRFYPDYKVGWKHLEGEIYFSLPLGDRNANNLVNTIKVKSISWNELEVTEAWSSVTFDRNGIFGKIEGHAYGGMLTSDFAIYFKGGFPWEGHFFALNVNSQPIAEKLASAYFSLTGDLNGKLTVKGESKNIVHSEGSLKLKAPGKMEIKSIDNLISRMPADWNFVKRDLVKILLESFRTYNYTHGELILDYEPPKSVAALRLSGREGERNFTINWLQE